MFIKHRLAAAANSRSLWFSKGVTGTTLLSASDVAISELASQTPMLRLPQSALPGAPLNNSPLVQTGIVRLLTAIYMSGIPLHHTGEDVLFASPISQMFTLDLAFLSTSIESLGRSGIGRSGYCCRMEGVLSKAAFCD